MSKATQPATNVVKPQRPTTPKCLAIVGGDGIKTSHDFTKAMSAIMSDLVEGSITPGIANAMCNAGGKMLKMIDLESKYGRTFNSDNKPKILTLVS